MKGRFIKNPECGSCGTPMPDEVFAVYRDRYYPDHGVGPVKSVAFILREAALVPRILRSRRIAEELDGEECYTCGVVDD